MKEKQDRMARLMAKKVLGVEISAGEERELEEWLAASEDNRMLFGRVKRLSMARDLLQLEAEQYGEEMVRRFRYGQKKTNARRIRRTIYRWMGSAAAIALVIGGLWWMSPSGGQHPETHLPGETEIVPGQGKAVLTLAGGRQIDVLKAENGNVFVDTEGNRIIPEQVVDGGEGWHTLSVPPGGEFCYTLADSTKVWLNSASELRFPAAFAGSERQVYLKGEAFFDVRKDRQKPFVVSLQDGNITVYGTRFTVTDYEESPLSAVLVEGSIGFTANNGKAVRLTPADRLVYEAEQGMMTVEKVDTTLYTAWIHQLFIFQAQPLGEIMTTLARWYDVDVTFLSEDIKNIRLSGRLNRYQDIRILLRTYEQTAGIRFQIDGRNIIVAKREER